MKVDKSLFANVHGIELEFDVTGVSQASNLKRSTIAFSLAVTSSLEEQLRQISNVVIFVPSGEKLPDDCYKGNVLIHVTNPRYEYINTTSKVFKKKPAT